MWVDSSVVNPLKLLRLQSAIPHFYLFREEIQKGNEAKIGYKILTGEKWNEDKNELQNVGNKGKRKW